jgi:hypothetical protein
MRDLNCDLNHNRAGAFDRLAASPPPWTVEDIGAAFVVRDQNGQGLAYIYFEDEPGRQTASKMLSKDEARRITVSPDYRK